ncbi:pentatricopeptide repeat-containing protein At3g49170, chloroplastic [Zea mays]|uniref:Putative pentatricopeptide repeat family protein n=1 Tax=Zea mays TaxID=4577 RepID=A0A1D6M0U6_MAIZE|nr:pentatricopeptide repeat-containing protein At3g49170, chloroplastic [Zea mays]AQK84909.1 Putative pentatricopeptide repeat family protein [Zea mays]|eukprot:XP_008649476.1 pentatricopeptide repeat-containing protein At3g49170, chloroplastic [Zea mays]
MATVRSTLPPSLPPPSPSSPPAHTLAATSRHRKPLTTTAAGQAALQPSEAAALLTAAARARDIHLGRALQGHLLRTGSLLETDAVVANSLLTLYSKCSAVAAARSVFDGMPVGLRDLVSWTAMASCLSRNGAEAEALRLFGETLEEGLLPNAFTLCAATQACFASELFHLAGGAVLGLVFKLGFWGTDVSVGCALIDMFAKNGDLVAMRRVFDGLFERTVVVWTLLITRYAQSGYSDEAVELFLDMLENGFQPDQYTLSSMLSACTELGSFRLGQQLHSLALRLGLESDSCVSCGLVDMYAKSHNGQSLHNAREVFNRMPKHNVMAWTALLSGYVQRGSQDNQVMILFCKMLNEGIRPNHITYSSMLKACANLGDQDSGRQIHTHCVKSNLADLNVVGNALVSMYAESGSIEEARHAFDQLYEKNMVSFSGNLDGDGRSNTYQDYQIERMELGISTFTFGSLISAAASVGMLTKGQRLHALSLKAGFGSDRAIGNSLVSMYSRCGYLVDACQVFDEMNDHNVISWTSMISGLAKHGYAARALELFHDMIAAGVKPNDVTYIAVLSACSHAGLVKEGKEHFRMMQKHHGLIPRMEHYACMVDLLGRSGLVEDALDFINEMPCQVDALVWKTLLGACKTHNNMDIGEIAANHVIQLEPQDPAPYVLLSNLYAEAGLWDQVARIRSLMRDKNLMKEKGLSWMHVDNTIHEFRAGDTSHPQAEEIYTKLETLIREIKVMGYVPDTSVVLHDMSDELKELCLLQHSEKIAVAFGLISCTSATKPIRIFKNLRVCVDCHSALKYVSKATGREIILRDSNRFHRMKDGECSCGEYW